MIRPIVQTLGKALFLIIWFFVILTISLYMFPLYLNHPLDAKLTVDLYDALFEKYYDHRAITPLIWNASLDEINRILEENGKPAGSQKITPEDSRETAIMIFKGEFDSAKTKLGLTGTKERSQFAFRVTQAMARHLNEGSLKF